MTKKSEARLEKDRANKEINEKLKTNTAWDELDGLKNGLIREIHKMKQTIVDIYAVPEIIHFLKSPKNTADIMRCLSADIVSIMARITQVGLIHAGKVGGWRTEEEYFKTLPIYEEYVSITNEIAGTLMPSINILLEDYNYAIAAANAKIEEKAKTEEENLLDPSVISDATLKE